MPIAINGSGTISGVSAGGLQAGAGPVLMTARASTSGTSIDFTGIPSWAKRITVMFNGVSTNGTSQKLVRIGAGSIVTSGYAGNSSFIAAASVGTLAYTDGFNLYNIITAGDVLNGHLILTNVSGNIWVCSAAVGNSAGTIQAFTTGSVTLSGTLDRIRITTVNGTDTFDAGTINVMYE